MFKTFEEAAIAVDDMFSTAFQNAGRKSDLLAMTFANTRFLTACG